MRVENLVPWVGPDFAFRAGDEIDLPDDVAEIRTQAGLCRPIKPVKAKHEPKLS